MNWFSFFQAETNQCRRPIGRFPPPSGRAGRATSLGCLGRRGGRSGGEPRPREAAELNGGTSAWPGLPPARHFVISANDFAGTPGRSPGSSKRLVTTENGFAGLRTHCLMSPNRFVISRATFIIPRPQLLMPRSQLARSRNCLAIWGSHFLTSRNKKLI